MAKFDPYSYPNDGRTASSDPGFWNNTLSFLPNSIPWEHFIVELNSPLDQRISRHVIRYPYSPLTPILNFLFGKRGH